MNDLTKSELKALRLAHWPVDPPEPDDRFKTHRRIEEAVQTIVQSRAVSARSEARETFERILTGRTYDRHAADPEIFDELLDELADAHVVIARGEDWS